MIKSITVVIPTANRANMLVDALTSVSNQSAKGMIQEVIVSENSLNADSKQVVGRFMGILPVSWIQQETPVLPHIHALRLTEMVNTSHVALLADDDIWDRYHLQEACRAFDMYPSICAFFGQAVVVENSNCQVLQRFNGTFDQLSDMSSKDLLDIKCWDQQLTALNQISSTLNMWACVATAVAYKDAILNSCGHPIYGSYPASDILFIWRLSYHGDIAVGRHISLFYRRHAASHMQTVMKENAILGHEQALAIRKEICRQAVQLGFDPLGLWREAYQRLKAQHLAGGLPTMYKRHYRWLESGGNYNVKPSQSLMIIRGRLLLILRLLIPPVFIVLFRKLAPPA